MTCRLRLDDLARNLGQRFESPAARLEIIRRATAGSRDRILAETMNINRADVHAFTNRMHERRPQDMTREEIEAGLKAFPPLARVVEGIRQRYPDAAPVAAKRSEASVRPARAKLPSCAAGSRER